MIPARPDAASAASSPLPPAERTARLLEVATALAGAATLETVADVLIRLGGDALGAVAGALAVLDAAGTTVSLVGTHGYPAAAVEALRHVPLASANVLAEAIRAAAPVWITSREERTTRFPVLAAALGTDAPAAAAAVPLLAAGGRALGALGLSFARPGALTDDVRAFAQALAALGALALERALAFDAERAARADLETVLEVVPVGIGIAPDPACHTIRANPALAAQLAVPTNANPSKTRPDGVDPPFRVYQDGRELAPHELPMQRVARDGVAVREEEFDIVRADGSVVRLLEYAAPLRDADGRVRGAVGAFVDITERTRLVAAEREARAAAERAAERAARLVAVTAALGRVASPQEVAEAILREGMPAVGASAGVVAVCEATTPTLMVAHAVGYPEAAVQSWAGMRLDAEAPAPHVVRTGRSLFVRDNAERARLFPAFTAAFPQRFEGAASVPLATEHGVAGALIFSFAEPRDFGTEDRELIETLGRLCAQALERARLFEAERVARAQAEHAWAEAQRANRAKSEFLAIMSHELRTPLNAIGGYAELLELEVRGPVTAAQREDLRRIRRSQKHLLGLINEVLNYTRLETGRVGYEIVDVPLVEVAQAVEALVAPQLRARGLHASIVPADAPPAVVRGDAEKLRQILVNLLGNAVKFTEPGGRVSLSWSVEGPQVAIRVADTGIGIPADRMDDIFEPFVQVHAGLTRPHEGTGLGLAISRDLARGMGGDLLAASVEGAGSTFTLLLPRAVPATGDAAATAVPEWRGSGRPLADERAGR